MQVRKRDGSDFYHYDFQIDGQRYRGTTLRTTKKEAEAVMAQEYRKVVDQRQLGLLPHITLDEAFDVTLAEVEGQTHRLYTVSRNKLMEVIKPNQRLADLQQSDIERFVTSRRKEGRKNNTIKGDLKALNRVIQRVSRTHAVNTLLQMPTIKTEMKSRHLSEDEEQKVLKTLKADPTVTAEKAHDLGIVLLDTGMRLMEAVNLSHSDISMSDLEIEVYRPKTKAVSIVPMSSRVSDVLKRRSNYAKPFEKMQFAIIHLRKVINECCNGDTQTVERRGKATIHTLRDTYATRMLKRGMTLHELANLLGHTNTAMTAKYAHLEKTDVVNKARSLLNG